jgi:hypothetical protein
MAQIGQTWHEKQKNDKEPVDIRVKLEYEAA